MRVIDAYAPPRPSGSDGPRRAVPAIIDIGKPAMPLGQLANVTR